MYVTNVMVPVVSESGALLQTITKRVMLVST
jgi:hypothetical protein